MNKKAPLSVQTVSLAIAQLMPNIIRGVQLDFFAKRAITQTQFLMIVGIHAYGRCTMGKLAKNMKIKMPTATGLADRLAKAGYAKRFNDVEDRRKVWIELTPKGKQFIAEFQTVLRRRWEEVMRVLAPGELESFYQVVSKLRDSLHG